MAPVSSQAAEARVPPRTRRSRPDPFGYDPDFHARVRPLAEFLYSRYWRVRTDGLTHLPEKGPALLIGNHSGGIPFDAVMIAAAVDLEHSRRRLVRFLYDRFVADMPLMGDVYTKLGAMVASFDNGRRLLERGEVVGMFPEGVAGVAKGIGQRYRVQSFHTGFVRLALTLGVPIIPVAVVGAEEIYPVIGKWERLGVLKGMLNVPYIPITPLFPLFGPLGMIPLPTRWHIRFGAPLCLSAGRTAPEAVRRATLRVHAERIRRQVQGMVHTLLAERESMFF